MYSCVTLSDHEKLPCPGSEGRLDSFAILFPGYESEFETDADFEDEMKWQSAVAAGLAKVVNGVKGSAGEPSHNETENPLACGTENILSSVDHEFAFTDKNISQENNQFYSELKAIKAAGFAVANCEGKMEVYKLAPQFYTSGRAEWPDGRDDFRQYHLAVHLHERRKSEAPLLIDKPDGWDEGFPA